MHWLKKRPGPSTKGTGLNSVLQSGGPTYINILKWVLLETKNGLDGATCSKWIKRFDHSQLSFFVQVQTLQPCQCGLVCCLLFYVLIGKSFHHLSFWSKCKHCNSADVDLSVVQRLCVHCYQHHSPDHSCFSARPLPQYYYTHDWSCETDFWNALVPILVLEWTQSDIAPVQCPLQCDLLSHHNVTDGTSLRFTPDNQTNNYLFGLLSQYWRRPCKVNILSGLFLVDWL